MIGILYKFVVKYTNNQIYRIDGDKNNTWKKKLTWNNIKNLENYKKFGII